MSTVNRRRGIQLVLLLLMPIAVITVTGMLLPSTLGWGASQSLPPRLVTEPDPPNCDLGRLEQGAIGVWSFQIKNGGGGLLEWQAVSDRSWISLQPQSGSLKPAEMVALTVTVDTAGLPPGHHQGHISIDSNGGSKTGLITVEVFLRGGLADTPWPTFHHDPQRTGRSLLRGPESPEALWAFATAGPIWSSPVIGPDGTIYITTVNGWLYALTPEGHERWSLELGGIITASPAIGRDGTIYLGNNHGLYAISPTGEILWTVELGSLSTSSPIIGQDGTIYVGGERLFAISPDGKMNWEFKTAGYIDNSAPALGADGTIYVGFSNIAPGGVSKLVALNPNGTERWEFHVSGPIPSSPAVGEDGTVYFPSKEGRLYAVSRGGRLRWSKYITVFPRSAFLSSPAIGADGTIYVGSDDYALYAFSPAGKELWHFTTGAPIHSSPAIDGAGTIYVGSADGELYALNPDGSLKWRFPTGGPLLSSPAIGTEGMIYIGSNDGNLYAIGNPRRAAIFQFSNLVVTPTKAAPGEDIHVQAEVANHGDVPGAVIVELKVDGSVRARQTVELAPGEATLVSFTLSFSATELGSHRVTIDGLSPVEVIITGDSSSSNDSSGSP